MSRFKLYMRLSLYPLVGKIILGNLTSDSRKIYGGDPNEVGVGHLQVIAMK